MTTRRRARRSLLGLAGCLVAAVLGLSAPPASAVDCDPAALTIVQHFLQERDAREYRRAQRYLSSDFGQHFRDAYGMAYLEYFGDPDVLWSQSVIQGSSLAGNECAVSVTSIRDAEGVSAAAAETYTLVMTYRGWLIDRWQWSAP